jgi:hypothetical protein
MTKEATGMYFHVQDPESKAGELTARFVNPLNPDMGGVKTLRFEATRCILIEPNDDLAREIVRHLLTNAELTFSESPRTITDVKEDNPNRDPACPHH